MGWNVAIRPETKAQGVLISRIELSGSEHRSHTAFTMNIIGNSGHASRLHQNPALIAAARPIDLVCSPVYVSSPGWQSGSKPRAHGQARRRTDADGMNAVVRR
jgi:hypothetical protein